MREPNIVTLSDSYKVSQSVQYPPDTTKIHSYFSGRGLSKGWPFGDEMVYFGGQYLMMEYLEGKVVTKEKIQQAQFRWGNHFGSDVFRPELWYHILDKHAGRLPIRIRSLREGSVVPVGTVLMTIENTDPECYWLTNWLETLMVQLWYPCTVATQSRYMKKTINRYLEDTGSPEGLPFKLHDFGYRGCTSREQAGIGSAAHLLSFLGTDTFAGCELLMDYYGCEMPGFSIPATEHSTITSWGRSREVDAYANLLEKYPTGLVACVSDSYDIYKAAADLWGSKLKDKVMERDGTLVIRPDSGDPLEVLPDLLSILGDSFGSTTNAKGFKVLPDQVRVIQGDGIDPASLDDILRRLKVAGWSADNIAFGSGGGLLQKDINRDTLKHAFKCSYMEMKGYEEGFDVYKDPITDPGKSSLRGRQDHEGLVTVFENGELVALNTLEDMRERARI